MYVINNLPHAEETAKQSSRSTLGADAGVKEPSRTVLIEMRVGLPMPDDLPKILPPIDRLLRA